MKNNLKVVSLVLIISTVFSGLLLLYKVKDVIIPSLDKGGVYAFVYIICAILLIEIVLKLFVGVNGFLALANGTSQVDKQKKLTLSGKLAVPIVACGLLDLALKLFYHDQFLVIDIFDIVLCILLGLMYIVCSMYIRTGRE